MTPSLRWNDLHVGQTFHSPSRTITEADVIAFAGLTGDYSELHTSAAFAAKTEFGQRVAHGLLGLAYAHGLMWPRTGELRDCAVAFLGITDWSFRKPIFLGDTIHVHYTISNLRISQSNPRHGIVTFQVKVHNQYDDTLQEGTKVLLCSTDIVGPMADDSREQHE